MNEREYIAAISEIPITGDLVREFVETNRQPVNESPHGAVELNGVRSGLTRVDPVVSVAAAVFVRAIALMNASREVRLALSSGVNERLWNAVATAPLASVDGYLILDEAVLKAALESSGA
jgi:hypothetical protein